MTQATGKYARSPRDKNRPLHLEDEFWTAFVEIAARLKTDVGTLIDEMRNSPISDTLSGSLRVYVLEYYRNKAAS